MRTLVTGATGFVGRHVCAHLREQGIEAIAVSQEGEADVVVDVRDRDGLMRAFASTRPDSVIHLAAIAYVPQANADPDVADAVNRGGTANVLDGARSVDACTLFVSSAAVYGRVPDARMPITEEEPVAPGDAYGE